MDTFLIRSYGQNNIRRLNHKMEFNEAHLKFNTLNSVKDYRDSINKSFFFNNKGIFCRLSLYKLGCQGCLRYEHHTHNDNC